MDVCAEAPKAKVLSECTVVEPYAVAVSKRSEVRKPAQEPQQPARLTIVLQAGVREYDP